MPQNSGPGPNAVIWTSSGSVPRLGNLSSHRPVPATTAELAPGPRIELKLVDSGPVGGMNSRSPKWWGGIAEPNRELWYWKVAVNRVSVKAPAASRQKMTNCCSFGLEPHLASLQRTAMVAFTPVTCMLPSNGPAVPNAGMRTSHWPVARWVTELKAPAELYWLMIAPAPVEST